MSPKTNASNRVFLIYFLNIIRLSFVFANGSSSETTSFDDNSATVESTEVVTTETILLSTDESFRLALFDHTLKQDNTHSHSINTTVNNCDTQVSLDVLNPWAVINSPNYPDAYPSHTSCTVIITAPSDNFQAELLFTNFHIHSDNNDVAHEGDERYVKQTDCLNIYDVLEHIQPRLKFSHTLSYKRI